MRSILFVLFLFLSLVAKGQQDDSDYPTRLKGGYKIVFKTDTLDRLYLQKGDKIITELSDGSKGMLQKSLGYLGADFMDYFVLVHSFGSGNPHEIELIKKSTGNNILQQGACWVDADEKSGFLLYTYDDMPHSSRDKMILYNVVTKQKKYLSFPPEIFKQDFLDIAIVKVNDSLLVIKYPLTNGGEKQKTYRW